VALSLQSLGAAYRKAPDGCTATPLKPPVAGLTRGEPATGVSAPVLLSKLQAEMPLLIPYRKCPEGSNVIEELPQPVTAEPTAVGAPVVPLMA